MSPTFYCCGFLFDREGKHVLLVRKNKPVWQAGRLNGIGGLVEEGESSLAAMKREFNEEACHGMRSRRIVPEWTPFATISVPEKAVVVDFWRATTDYQWMADRDFKPTDTGEKLVLASTSGIEHRKPIPNLPWLIPLALDREVNRIVHVNMKAS